MKIYLKEVSIWLIFFFGVKSCICVFMKILFDSLNVVEILVDEVFYLCFLGLRKIIVSYVIRRINIVE